jgi:pSer/pThr/pTyr-binding forkhead associated (FHA) protein
MKSPSEQLSSHLQTVQRFLIDRLDREPAYANIINKVTQLESALNRDRFLVKIACDKQWLKLAQALQELLTNQSSLGQVSQVQIETIPNEPITNYADANLIVESTAARQNSIHYKLNPAHKWTIGRNPQAKIPISENLKQVSGFHAQIKPLEQIDGVNNYPGWQICDLNSKNGTYVNDKRISGCYPLQSGDRICLGSPKNITLSINLVFEYSTPQLVDTAPSEPIDLNILNCDVFCLLVNLVEELSEREINWIEAANSHVIGKVLIITAIPSHRSSIPQYMQNNLMAIESWVKQKFDLNKMEVIPLILLSNFSSSDSTLVVPHSQLEFEQLCQSLENFRNNNTKEKLADRLAKKLLNQIVQIEKVIDISYRKTIQKIQQNQQKSQQLILPDRWQEKAQQSQQQALEDKDIFFEDARKAIDRSTLQLLDNSIENSICHKLEDFIYNRAQPLVTKQEKVKYVELELQAKNRFNNTHEALLYLCQMQLEKWLEQEYSNIVNLYHDGGLRKLTKEIKETLKVVPFLNITKSWRPSLENTSLHSIFKTVIVKPEYKTSYKEVSWVEYIIRKVKTNLLMFLIVAVASIAIALNLIKVDGTLALAVTILSLVVIIILLGIILSSQYAKEKELKLKQAEEELRKNSISYYQKVAQKFADRTKSFLLANLELEEKQIGELIEEAKQQIVNYQIETEQQQIAIQEEIEQLKEQQKSLEQDKLEIQKFHQKIG